MQALICDGFINSETHDCSGSWVVTDYTSFNPLSQADYGVLMPQIVLLMVSAFIFKIIYRQLSG